MSVSFTNDSLPPPDSSLHQCSDSKHGLYLLSTSVSTYVLFVLPLSLFVLYLGLQRWRRQRSLSSAAAMTHSDFFTYNMAVIELIGVFGYVLYFSSLAHLLLLLSVAAFFKSFTWFAQILLPIVTCVDRYVAAVHPITYLGLRQAGGVRIRNLTAGGVWLISAAGGGLLFIRRFYDDNNILPLVTPQIVSLVVMMFCSLSVLRVLIRPRPGKVGGDRVQVDQSKQRAVHTMTVIMGTLWLRFGGNVVSIMMKSLAAESVGCAGEALNFLFSLPSSVVLFLLFLHRAGKLPTCKHNEA